MRHNIIILYIICRAGKRLIVINRIQNNVCVYINDIGLCVCTVYTYFVYIYKCTFACMYLRNICYLYIKYFNLYII